MSYAALDEQTTTSVLGALANLRAQAEAYASGVRSLAPTGPAPVQRALGRAGRVLAATVDWCIRTGAGLRGRLRELASAAAGGTDPGPMSVFANPAELRRQGAADGRRLGAEVAADSFRSTAWPSLTLPSLAPDYAGALLGALPPEALARLAAAPVVPPALAALLGISERAGRLPQHVLELPSEALGHLLAATTFSTGFVVAAVRALLVGKSSEPLTQGVLEARIAAVRVAAEDPVAARRLLTAGAPAAQILRYAAGSPGFPAALRAQADDAAAALVRAGLDPRSGTPDEVSAAWREVLHLAEAQPDLVAPHGRPARAVNRALIAAFVPFLPYVAWQGRTGPAGSAPRPVFVPEVGMKRVARFFGSLLADVGALAGLRAAVLGYARSLGLATLLRNSPADESAIGRAGSRLGGAFSLLGYAAEDARLSYQHRVDLQAGLLAELLGTVFTPLEAVPGAKFWLDLVLVPSLVDGFVKGRMAAGPKDGRTVLAATADEVVRGAALPAPAAATLRAVVLGAVLEPVLGVTDPGYRP